MTTGPDWVEQARRLYETAKAAAEAHEPTAECTWCLHCQLLAVLRGDRPEVTAVLSDVLATASAALRSFSGETPAEEPAGHAEEPTHRDPPPVVQRIDLA